MCIACLVVGSHSPVMCPAQALKPDVSDDACTRAVTRDFHLSIIKRFSCKKILQCFVNHPRLRFFFSLKYSDICFGRLLVLLSLLLAILVEALDP